MIRVKKGEYLIMINKNIYLDVAYIPHWLSAAILII